MRKLLVLVCSVVLSVCVLAACGKVDESKIIKKSVSDMTNDILSGSSDDFTMEISAGFREAPYALDGACSTTGKMFVIKATPKSADMKDDSVEYSFTAGGQNYSGVLTKSKYRNSYSTDLKKEIACGKELAVTIKWGEKTSEVKCASILKDGMMTADQAVDKVIEKYGEKLSSMFENKNFMGELAVRLVSDKADAAKLYWYVAVVKSKTEISSMLIDATSGEFVAERNA